MPQGIRRGAHTLRHRCPGLRYLGDRRRPRAPDRQNPVTPDDARRRRWERQRWDTGTRPVRRRRRGGRLCPAQGEDERQQVNVARVRQDRRHADR